jgi:hypothetical protein
MSLGWLLFAVFSILLDVIVIYYLVRGPWQRVPGVLGVCAVQILVGGSNALFLALLKAGHVYYQAYWTGDVLAHAAVLSLILSLIYHALAGEESQKTTTRLLVLGVVCFALFSVYSFFDPHLHLNRWMTPISRNLSFCEEVLNLILWTILLQRRNADHLLLLVSAGIGVQVTGEVIGITLRLYTSASTVWIPNTLVALSEILCLVIWIWAFRGTSGGPRTPSLDRKSAP